MEFHPLGLLLCSALHIAPYFEGELVCEHLEHDLVVFRVMPHRSLDSEGSEKPGDAKVLCCLPQQVITLRAGPSEAPFL